MRVLSCGLIIVALWAPNWMTCQTSTQPDQSPDSRVFRDPFTLKLRTDEARYYEEHYDKRIPYVSNNDVYLFSGEDFGVNLTASGDLISVTYQPDAKKADVWFSFKQAKELGGVGMMLIVKNNLKGNCALTGS
jgi:hypothetical protein